MRKRVAILISGRGSNMRALVEAARAPDYPAEIVLVVSNRPQAAGIRWASEQGLPVRVLDHTAYARPADFEHDLHEALQEARTELVCLAGFMRLISADMVEKWRDRMLNIHPSLLPAFRGLHTHERVLAAGVRITGCTVHVVRPEVDTGPILAQAAVPVLEADTPDTLAERVLAAEHRIYPQALAWFASGRACVDGERMRLAVAVNHSLSLFSPAL